MRDGRRTGDMCENTRVIWKVRSTASQLHNALIECYHIIHFGNWNSTATGWNIRYRKSTWGARAAHARNK